MFRRVPDHSQWRAKASADVERRHWRELKLVRNHLARGATFLELGAGDCQFALALCEWAGRVVAVDVSTEIVAQLPTPSNFELRMCDGVSVPVAPHSVDVVYSNQLIEHLHPDDVRAQLRAVHVALRPGGTYLCLTPHSYTGPHDVSRGFDDVASGFHLHEYTSGELCTLLRECGFVAIRQLVGARGRYVPLPPWLGGALERLLAPLPMQWRRRLGELPILRMMLHRLMVIARTPA